jgi:hypothetical protein
MEQRVSLYRDSQVRDFVAAYETARTRGDLLDMCVKAGLITGAYLDAGDAGDSNAWKLRRQEDCALAKSSLSPQSGAGGD